MNNWSDQSFKDIIDPIKDFMDFDIDSFCGFNSYFYERLDSPRAQLISYLRNLNRLRFYSGDIIKSSEFTIIDYTSIAHIPVLAVKSNMKTKFKGFLAHNGILIFIEDDDNIESLKGVLRHELIHGCNRFLIHTGKFGISDNEDDKLFFRFRDECIAYLVGAPGILESLSRSSISQVSQLLLYTEDIQNVIYSKYRRAIRYAIDVDKGKRSLEIFMKLILKHTSLNEFLSDYRRVLV